MSPDRSISPSAEKDHYIQRAEAESVEAFSAWLKNCSPDALLVIPDDALAHFISRRAYELATDPTRIKTIVLHRRTTSIEFYVAEEMPHPVSDPESLMQYHKHVCEVNELKNNGLHADKLPLPDDVNDVHLEFIDDVIAGRIGLRDRILTGFFLMYKNDVLFIANYSDSTATRRQGLATAQYARLNEIATALGFRVIVGENDATNVNFFTRNLGRILLKDAPEDIQELVNRSFPDFGDGGKEKQDTVQLLS